MGLETVPDRASQQRMKLSWINNFRDVLIGDFVPRGISGSPRVRAGRLGSTTYKWKRAYIQLGYLGVGDVINFMDYAANIPLPQGFMLCNGVIINEANYDAQHSAGDWDNFIVSSVLDGKYLPNMADTYVRGKTGTLQSGASAITKVGSNTSNFSHTHGGAITSSANGGSNYHNDPFDGGSFMTDNHTHTLTLASALSATQTIRPASIETKFIMRIV